MDSFVLGGTEVAERRVQPAGVVPALDVLEDGASKSCSRRPARASMSSRLMVAKNDSATALSQHSPLRPTESTTPLAPRQLGEVTARVLTAAVGMEDDALLGCALGEGHLEGVFDQLGAHVVGQGPADDPAGGQVDDRRQVGPALPGGDVGDVADVAPVESPRTARSGAG